MNCANDTNVILGHAIIALVQLVTTLVIIVTRPRKPNHQSGERDTDW